MQGSTMRREPSKDSHLNIYPLKSEKSTKALSALLNLLSSCSGPQGKNQIVQNACGGHVTLTSTSTRLLNSILFTRPELKMLVNAVLSHTQEYLDCGLFMACMSLQLIKNSLKLDLHGFVLNSVLQHFSKTLHDYINSDDCKVVVKADFTELNVLLALTRSILTSKSLLNLKSIDCDMFCQKILNAFIESIPEHSGKYNSDRIFIRGVDVMSTKESFSEKGVFLEAPELSCFEEISSLPVKMSRMKIDDHTEETFIRVVLVTCSMSGDLEEIPDVQYEVSENQSKLVENSVIGEMTAVCQELERLNVGILLCQKVIHPKVKAVLKSRGILFVDRIGSQPVPYLLDLTGCKPVSSFLTIGSQLEYHIGRATGIKHLILKKRSYLHLSSDNSNIVTLVLCSEWEERLAELKCCVKACLRSLEYLVLEPKLLMGAGCWQTHCFYVLKQQVLSTLPDITEELSCTGLQVKQALEVFRSSLVHWCYGLIGKDHHLAVDESSFHAWKVPKSKDAGLMQGKDISCCCGFQSTKSENLEDFEIIPSHCTPSSMTVKCSKRGGGLVEENGFHDHMILDSLSAALNGFGKGVQIAGLLLTVGQFIDNKN